MSQTLLSIRDQYPELRDIPDQELIEGVKEQNPDVASAIRFEQMREQQIALERDSFNAEQDVEQRINDAELFGDGPTGRILQKLAPGGRAIMRGAGQLVEGVLGAQDAVAAAPRVWFGDNPATQFLEKNLRPTPLGEQIRSQAQAHSGTPNATSRSLSDAFEEGGLAPIEYLTEKGAEQIPNLAVGAATGGAGTLAGLSPKAAALLGTALTTFPQEMGGAYNEIKQSSGKEAPGTAGLVGLINTFLEFGGDAKVIQQLLGGDKIIANTAREYIGKFVSRAAGQAGKEAVIEPLQELSTAGIPALTGQAELPDNLAERMGEASIIAMLPGGAGSVVANASQITPGQVLTPPKLGKEMVAADADAALAEYINGQRVLLDDARKKKERDDSLAASLASAKQQADRERSLAQQSGTFEAEKNRIAVSQAIAEADALLASLAPKTESSTTEIPLLTSRINVEATPTTRRMEAEAARRAAMTPQQLAALEALERPAAPNQRVARIPDTTTGLDEVDGQTLVPSPVDWAVQQAPADGRRVASVPDTTTNEYVDPATAEGPSPVDWAVGMAKATGQVQRIQGPPAPNRTVSPGLSQADAEAALNDGTESTDAEGPSPVDWQIGMNKATGRVIQKPVNPNAPEADIYWRENPYLAPEPAQPAPQKQRRPRSALRSPAQPTAKAVAPVAAPTAPPTVEEPAPVRSRRTERVFGEQRPRDLIDEISDAFGKLSLKNIRKLEPNFTPTGALRKLFSAGSKTEWDQAADTMSRAGHFKGDPASVTEFLDALDKTQADRKANRADSARQNRDWKELEKQHVQFQRVVVDGKRPKPERRKVKRIRVDRLIEGDQFTVQGEKFTVQEMEWDPETDQLLSITLKDGQKFGVQRVDASEEEYIHVDRNSLNLKYREGEFLGDEAVESLQNQDGTEVQEPVDTTTVFQEDETVQPEALVDESAWTTPTLGTGLDVINQFVDTETSTKPEAHAAWNLIARAFGKPDLFKGNDPARQLAENDPALNASVQGLVNDAQKSELIQKYLDGEPRVSIGQAAVQAAINELAPSGRVTVIHDPSLYKDGKPVAGYVDENGRIFVNSAFIDSAQMARDVALEEMLHTIYNEADVQDAWADVVASVTDSEVQAMIDAGYAPDVALEEAATRKVIEQINKRNTEGVVRKFIRTVVNALKRVFGITGQDAYAVLLAKALKGGMMEGSGVRYSKRGRSSLRMRMTRQKIVDAVQSSSDWKDFYTRHVALIEEVFGSDADLFQKLLPATSQAQNVGGNVTLALKAYVQLKTGQNFDGRTRGENPGYLPDVILNLERVRAEEEVSGKKIRAFTKANQGDTTQVVVDRHITMMMFGLGKKTPTDAQFAKASRVLTQIANEIGWTPREVQAALWAASIRRTGKNPRSYDYYINRLVANGTLAERLGQIASASAGAGAEGGAGGSDSGQGSTPRSRRYSLVSGYWRNANEVASDTANAGDPATIRNAAALEGSMIPPAIAQQVESIEQRLAAAPYAKSTAKDRVALRILNPLLNIRKLVTSATGGTVSPFSVAASTNLRSIPDEAKDIGADAVLKMHMHLQKLRDTTSERAGAAVNALSNALGKVPIANRLQFEVDTYGRMASQLARDYSQNIIDRIRASKLSLDEKQVRELGMLARNLTETFRGAGSAVASGMRNVAAEIPPAALTSAASAVQWIEARINNKALPPIMSDTAANWLFSSPHGRQLSPIEWDAKIHERLQVMKDLADEKSQLNADIQAFNAAMTSTGKTPSVKELFMKFEKFRTSMKDSMEKMRLIYKELDKAQAEYDGVIEADTVLQSMFSDPQYQSTVTDAQQHLNALTRGVKVSNATNGTETYLNPLTGAKVVIDTRPDIGTEKANLTKLRDLYRDVKKWLPTSTDPLLRSAWERELTYMEDYLFAVAPGLMSGQNLFGFKLPSGWQIPLNPLSRNFFLWKGRLDVRNNIFQRIGNRLILKSLQAGQVTDLVEKAFENLASGNPKSEDVVKERVIDALKSHGRGTSQEDVFQWWVPTIANRIIAQNQNPGQKPYAVGDYIAGHQITKEDMDAVQAMKNWQSAVLSILQKNSSDSQIRGLFLNPTTTTEEVAGKPLIRRATDYGMKMARMISEDAKHFVENWMLADPAGKLALLDQHFQQAVMGLITETNPEFNGNLDKLDAELFRKAADMDRQNTIPFSDLSGALDWIANERAAVTGRSVTDERVEAEERMIGYVDAYTTAMQNALGLDETVANNEFTKSGIPPAIVKAVGGGRNAFVTARGKLLAPSTFYTYSMAGDADRMKYKSSAISLLVLKEVEAAYSSRAAIERELEKYDGPNGLVAQAQKAAPMRSKFLARTKVGQWSQKKARSKDVMIDYKTLQDNKLALDVLIKGMERIAMEHITTPSDNAITGLSNELRRTFTGQVLSSFKSISTNFGGAMFMTAMLRRQLGSGYFLLTPFPFLWETAKAATGSITKKLRTIKGVDPTMKAIAKVPGFEQLLNAMAYNQLIYEQNRARAEAALLVDTPNPFDKARIKMNLPSTGGRLSEGDDSGMIISGLNRITSFPGIAQVLEVMKSTFPGATDRLANTVTYILMSRWINDMSGPAFDAWKRRDTGLPGWDDLSDPTNVFSSQEMSLPDGTALKAWRQILSPVGGLERLALDFYKRTKGMTAEQRAAEPFLTPEQEGSVAFEGAKMTNLPTPTTTPTVTQGKGLSGSMRKWMGLFLRYPIASQGFLENLSSTVSGESPNSTWKYASAAAGFALLLALGGLGMDAGQLLDEIVRGEPRTKPSLAQTIASGNPKDFAKYGGMAMAGIYPYLGEQVALAMGGTSSRPMLDANRMFVPFGLAADAQKMVQQIFQTGSAFYPVTDFVRRYSPAVGAVMNAMQPGELQAKAALRAARIGATADMDIRQTGGGTSFGSRETPLTPLIRTASNALLEGDTATYEEAVQKAVEYKVEMGSTPDAARRSVLASISSKDPATRLFGRKVTPEEDAAIQQRMSDSQRQAYTRARSAFAGIKMGNRRGRRSGLARVRSTSRRTARRTTRRRSALRA
jgi:hypothetical protein